MVTKWYKLILNHLKQNACYLLSIDCVDLGGRRNIKKKKKLEIDYESRFSFSYQP